ncbi:MAG: GAF domain-containing protein [Gemmatimonadales bacterium]|nr:MAG: GAF domain-containing protein [Gemmatimonadales bacterium]
MTSNRTSRELLPDPVVQVLEEYRRNFRMELGLWLPRDGDDPFRLYPRGGQGLIPRPDSTLLDVPTRSGVDLILEISGESSEIRGAAANALRTTLEQLYLYAEEVRYFTAEMSERYEEINLLYSISETLGSLLQLKDATHLILSEVCDVMGARRGSLWVHRPVEDRLHLVASVGEGGRQGPLAADDNSAVTAQVFREGRSMILSSYEGGTKNDGALAHGSGSGGGGSEPDRANGRGDAGDGGEPGSPMAGDSVLSVPIRYTPPEEDARTVGVINLIGRRRGGRFSASDQKLLAAIASQVGAALENNRLIDESLQRERVSREMELAHDLQMKLLPSLDSFDAQEVAARVRPADSVGGDFYHLLRLPGGRFGVMIGDVSSHGFPAALIMALTLSAATIYASEVSSPARVMTEMGRALRDELESTEMYITLFYAVVDPTRGELVYANAGHPHAFLMRGKEDTPERLPAINPPMGIAGDMEYEERIVPWASGRDLLVLFTDGLSDDLVAGSRRAGEYRILEEVAGLRDRGAKEIVDALFDLVVEEGRPEATPDDRTAVVLKV